MQFHSGENLGRRLIVAVFLTDTSHFQLLVPQFSHLEKARGGLLGSCFHLCMTRRPNGHMLS